MFRLFALVAVVGFFSLTGCSDPSAPENAPPNYPDMTDPGNMQKAMQESDADSTSNP